MMAKNISQDAPVGLVLIEGHASGDILVCKEGLSFWGGVCPDTGRIIDIHHPNYEQSVAGKILMMPSSRGSCSGSGVLLALALSGFAPAAIIFSESEDILSLGGFVLERIFNKIFPILRLDKDAFALLAKAKTAKIEDCEITSDTFSGKVEKISVDKVALNKKDRSLLQGEGGVAAKLAMEILSIMAAANGTNALVDITRGHIDGCILAHSANLIFAEKMAELGAQVTVPTTINAISIDQENWLAQGVPTDFGNKAGRLADAYVHMGARPVFTCAPYLLDQPPEFGEVIGWSESNAVIYANSVLGARTSKHPDYLDLLIAMTGRAPASVVYSDAGRRPQTILSVSLSAIEPDDLFWPVIGWLAGKLSPNAIPLITGLDALSPNQDDLKALCAAFGTTSGAPMLHISGHTPEADMPARTDAAKYRIDLPALQQAWRELNKGDVDADLVAIGSPHASFAEVKKIDDLMQGRRCHPDITLIITVGRDTLNRLKQQGIDERLTDCGVQLIADLCWCSITEPVFPVQARSIMTNSAKYAHYAHALSGRYARLSNLQDCIETAITGRTQTAMPAWLQ